ncbi:homeobox protein rough sheath 1-like [Prosopis cineraria]|uniref:homeobox protein rough sheath 1-like n=1 Tax=Prosopis cineraria TaxID=364024 RepID=UPI0024108770|nr:homeobox protein rough sheath 1-like [Prosopis cineraria]
MDNTESQRLHSAGENSHEQDLEKDDILKTRISSHPLYELLLQAHLQCLKVSEISNLEREQEIDQKLIMNRQSLDMYSEPELDLFMEAYCMALGKLKEAMEEPQQKVMAFINKMHSQLKELTVINALPGHQPPASPSSSAHCNILENDSSI